MKNYLFDVKIFASLRIDAESEEAAWKKLTSLLDCASANFGADETGDPIIAEVSLDTEDGGELVEIDGEAV